MHATSIFIVRQRQLLECGENAEVGGGESRRTCNGRGDGSSLTYYLPPPGGIVIRRVCLLVGSCVSLFVKGAITSKIKHAIKLKTRPARLLVPIESAYYAY